MLTHIGAGARQPCIAIDVRPIAPNGTGAVLDRAHGYGLPWFFRVHRFLEWDMVPGYGATAGKPQTERHDQGMANITPNCQVRHCGDGRIWADPVYWTQTDRTV